MDYNASLFKIMGFCAFRAQPQCQFFTGFGMISLLTEHGRTCYNLCTSLTHLLYVREYKADIYVIK